MTLHAAGQFELQQDLLEQRQGQADATEAILYLEQAISSGLDIPELHYHMGMAYLAANEPGKAREHLEKAVVEGASYPGLQEARLTFSDL